MPSTVPTQQQCFATAKLPKPKRVTFILEASTRVRNLAGADVFSQILWLKLDGLSNQAIAGATGLCVDTIADTISGWQTQVALKEPDNWEPLTSNRRKTRRSSFSQRPVHMSVNQPTPKMEQF